MVQQLVEHHSLHRVLLQEGKMLFEQEVYNNFTPNSPKPYFVTFAGDVSSPSTNVHVSCFVGGI